MLWVHAHVLVVKSKDLLVLGELKSGLPMAWEEYLCKGTAASWSVGFFSGSIWTWPAVPGMQVWGIMYLTAAFPSCRSSDLSEQETCSAWWEVVRDSSTSSWKSWSHCVPALAALAGPGNEMSAPALPHWTSSLLVSWSGVAPAGRQGSCAGLRWETPQWKFSHPALHHMPQCFQISSSLHTARSAFVPAWRSLRLGAGASALPLSPWGQQEPSQAVYLRGSAWQLPPSRWACLCVA